MKCTDAGGRSPDAFGPKAYRPDRRPTGPSRATSPWTSWASAASIWPSARGNNSIEAESSGMSTYAHELSHNLRIPDNYSNPYGAHRSSAAARGMWDMMSRGTFNGPGGPHTRCQIPPTQGASLGSQHNIRNKRFLNFVADADLLRLNRNGLAQSGLAVADVTAREVPHAARRASPACEIELDGAAGDNAPPCDYHTDRRCDGVRTPGTTVTGKYNDYTMEVVQQIGSDSFDPGHGVLISKIKNTLVTAARRQLLRVGHRLAPGGHQPRRLRQARRHAEDGDARRRAPAQRRVVQRGPGLRLLLRVRTDERTACTSTSSTRRTDAQGILHYKVAVKSLDGAGPQTRGVALPPPAARHRRGLVVDLHVPRSRTRAPPRRPIPALHPQDADRVPRQRHLPPVGLGHGHGLDGEAHATRSPPQVRRDGPGPGLRRRRPPARPRGHGHADGDVGERPVQDADRGLRARPTATSAAPCRRRCR